MSQGFVPLSCPPLQDCHFGKTGNDSAFQLPAQTTLQLLILISWPNRRYSRCWRLREGLTVVLWDVNLNPLPHKNCPIIQQADCVLSLLIPPPIFFLSPSVHCTASKNSCFFSPHLSFSSLKSASDGTSSGSRSTAHAISWVCSLHPPSASADLYFGSIK